MKTRRPRIRSALRWVCTATVIGWALLWSALFMLLAIGGEILPTWGIVLPFALIAVATGVVFTPRFAGLACVLLAIVGALALDLPLVRFAAPFVIAGSLLLVCGPWWWTPKRRADSLTPA